MAKSGFVVGGVVGATAIILLFAFIIIPSQEIGTPELITTDADFRVAFIGDQGLGLNSIAVLNLIKDDGAQIVLHQGDLDYEDDPEAWDKQISDVLGDDFPYFASIGGHDVKWDDYKQKMNDRLKKNPDVECTGNLGIKSICTYNGLFFMLIGPGVELIDESGFNSFIENQLTDNDYLWRICSWHNDMKASQTEANTNETGFEIYESCKNGGGIIANGHQHFYARSNTLIDFENKIVDNEWSEPNKLRVKEGATFTFVSGLGGIEIGNQDACFPDSYHTCNEEWSKIYTSDQDATFGALFCTFNAGGQPNKAYCYFKNIDGTIIDEFTVTNFLATYPDDTNLIDANMSGRDLTGDDFSNKIITDANLSNAILVDADMTNAILIGTVLTGADLTDANLTGVSLAYKDLTGTILRGADLTDASLTGVSLAYKDLTGTILRGADLTDANLTGFNFSGRDLTGTILRGVDLTGKNITGTILRGADLTDANLSGQDLSNHDLSDVILRKANLTDANLTGLDLSVMELTYANLSGQDLSNHDLSDVILTGANLSNSILPDNDLSGKNFESTVFNGVDLSGKDLSGSEFHGRETSFKNTNMENVNLHKAKFVDVDLSKIKSLAGAKLDGASFAYSNLSGVNLSEAHITRVNFTKATLTGLDFTGISNGIILGSLYNSANLVNANFENVKLYDDKRYELILSDQANWANKSNIELTEDLLKIVPNRLVVGKTQVVGNDLVVNFIYFNNFYNANLQNANFSNANLSVTMLENADLTNANLTGANLTGANLTGANLTGANLTGANLTGANLSNAILDGALLNEATILNCINHSVCKSG